MSHEQKDHVVELNIQNSQDRALRLYLEPWGEELSIPPTVTYKVEARGPEGDFLQIEVVEGGVAVYGWPGSIVSIFHNEKVVAECGVPVPGTPTRIEVVRKRQDQ
jgi:hypothetical protein